MTLVTSNKQHVVHPLCFFTNCYEYLSKNEAHFTMICVLNTSGNPVFSPVDGGPPNHRYQIMLYRVHLAKIGFDLTT